MLLNEAKKVQDLGRQLLVDKLRTQAATTTLRHETLPPPLRSTQITKPMEVHKVEHK
jgi:hypothetical protein